MTEQNTTALTKLNDTQLATWEGLLHAFDVAPTQAMVARGKARADGYLLGLLDAQVIGEAERQALYEVVTSREHAAAVRTA